MGDAGARLHGHGVNTLVHKVMPQDDLRVLKRAGHVLRALEPTDLLIGAAIMHFRRAGLHRLFRRVHHRQWLILDHQQISRVARRLPGFSNDDRRRFPRRI